MRKEPSRNSAVKRLAACSIQDTSAAATLLNLTIHSKNLEQEYVYTSNS